VSLRIRKPGALSRIGKPDMLVRTAKLAVLSRIGRLRPSQHDSESGTSQRDSEPGASGEPQQRKRGIRLTERGALLLMLTVFVLGLLSASWLNWPVLVGGSFLVGSAVAAWYARPAALLLVVVTPPLLFCVVLVAVKAVTASGDLALSVLAGTVITLVGAAPWLIVGTIASLIIAWSRGLRQSVSELRHELRHGSSQPSTGTGADAGAGPGPRQGDPRGRVTVPPRR
jgi:hypothetical protein